MFAKRSYLLYNAFMREEVDKLDRIIFQPSEQQRFIENVATKLGISTSSLASLLVVNERTLRDWKREKYHMSFIHAQTLARKSRVLIPASASLLKWNERLEKIGSLGGKAFFQKYGLVGMDETYRREQWDKWWNEVGKFKEHKILWKSKPFRKPKKSVELAEFVGLMLGDGGISKYQISITLHRNDDREYSIFVCELIYCLFCVEPRIIKRKGCLANDYRVSRVELVRFCVEKLGLVRGNKVRQNIDIPRWVGERNNFLISCVRGLFDTDGSVIIHKYKVSGREYIYKKLCFTSHSQPLRLSFYRALSNLGIKARLAGFDVRVDGQEEVVKYFKIVGTHNPKHLRKMNK